MNKEGDLDLASLRVFVRVAELAHFSRAAEGLDLPKARVSQVVGELEARLGTRLLQRTTRRVSLTPDGSLLLERARALLDEAADIGTLFQQEGELGGRLRVDLPVRLALQAVFPALPAFLDAHPGLQLELSCTDRRVDLIEEGVDAVLRVGPVHDTSLVARPLGQLPMVNVASPAYLDRHGRPRSPEELQQQGHVLVHYSQTFAEREAVFEWLDAAGAPRRLPLPWRVSVNNTDAFEAAALAGAGIVQLPFTGVREALAQGRLERLLPGCEAPPLPITLLRSARRHTPRRVRVFMDWLAQALDRALADARRTP